MQRHVFISYSSKDAESAERILGALERRGLKCWIAPRDVSAGGSYAESILTAIESASCFVLVFTQNANVSAHVMREVERALKFGINIVPVRFDSSNVGKTLDYLLATVHWLSAISEPVDRAAEKIAKAVGATPATAAASPSAVIGVPPVPARSAGMWYLGAASLVVLAGLAVWLLWPSSRRAVSPAVSAAPPTVAAVTPTPASAVPSIPPRAEPEAAAALTNERFNSDPNDTLEEGEMFVGVKKMLAFPKDQENRTQLKFPIRGIAKPAALIFDAIAPNYAFALGVHFPDYKRTAYLDVAKELPEAFEEDTVKTDWRVQATVYDIDNDGRPEVLVAINRWEKDFWDVSKQVELLVYTFHPPASEADLDRAENWALAGKAKGQFAVLLDDEMVIMLIGSRGGDLYLLKGGRLIEAGSVARDNNGRYVPDD